MSLSGCLSSTHSPGTTSQGHGWKADRRIWDSSWPAFGHVTLPYDSVPRQRELVHCSDRLKEYLEANPPPDRFFSSLYDDLFTCSVLAIDLLLDMGKVGRVDAGPLIAIRRGRRSPPSRLTRIISSGETVRCGTSATPRTDTRESGYYSHVNGFLYYAYLLERVGEDVPAVDRRSTDGTIPPVDEGALEALVDKDRRPSGSVRSGWSTDVAVGAKDLGQIRGTLPGLENALEEAKKSGPPGGRRS